ncbi:MAG TPA: DUF2085 domain-containing protein [Vicinamibacterales bacterium]|nr:DUF2085 domain-containing protein [Vicinamibacterales bacterium]
MSLVSEFIFAVGSVICHQRPERSFFVNGHQLPVCARCTGLYLGGALGLLVWMGVKIARGWRPMNWDPRLAARLIAVAAIPTALSVATGTLAVWDGSNVTRAVLAIPLGLSAGAIVAAVATKDLR